MNLMPILMYHQVVDTEPKDIHAVSLAAFENQMGWLHEQGYEAVTVDDLHVDDGSEPADPSSRRIAITFDDGYLDEFSHVLPILKAYDFKATIFLVARRVGGVNDWDEAPGLRGAPLLDWPQIEEMAGYGISFGAHTCTHPDLTAIPPRQAEEEIRESREIIEQRLMHPVRTFCYPYSRFNESIVEMVSRSGYSLACTYSPGHVGGAGEQRLLLQRTGVIATDTLEDFVRKVQARPQRRFRKFLKSLVG